MMWSLKLTEHSWMRWEMGISYAASGRNMAYSKRSILVHYVMRIYIIHLPFVIYDYLSYLSLFTLYTEDCQVCAMCGVDWQSGICSCLEKPTGNPYHQRLSSVWSLSSGQKWQKAHNFRWKSALEFGRSALTQVSSQWTTSHCSPACILQPSSWSCQLWIPPGGVRWKGKTCSSGVLTTSNCGYGYFYGYESPVLHVHWCVCVCGCAKVLVV